MTESTRRPRVLDLFCGEGGAAEGFRRAGFEVVGVDLALQPRYPFDFVCDDALRALETLISGGSLWPSTVVSGRAACEYRLADFSGVHASPPCQAHSDLQKQSKLFYRDFIPEVRELLRATGLPYVIENVEGAPLEDPVVLCGTMFPGLRVIRHRLFEANFPIAVPPHPAHPLVFTYDKRKAHYGQLDQDVSFVQVTGGGNCTVANKRSAMGVPWMSGHGANEAIPPAYTEHVGQYMMRHINGSG